MNRTPLYEYINPSQTGMTINESVDERGTKSLYMEGIFIEGDVRNANQRVYPVNEIANAVKTLQEQISEHGGVLGELDHPNDLKINLDRVSHLIVNIKMDGSRGVGKLKVLPTPMGNLVKTMSDAGVKLGVSSRGSGEVDDRTGRVSDFEIITVDVVAQPSAPHAYPRAIYESLMNHQNGNKLFNQLNSENSYANDLNKHIKNSIINFIDKLGLK